ncbi:glycosyltransferase, partial [Acinetobacter baumannii]|uniref:glycosyltransferase n=1 Tax=Acinetobacter baumannii TaxID=470 RepID=UPI000A82661E
VLPVKRRLLKRLVLWLYKLGISRAKQVIFLNPDDLSELEAAGALPPGKGFLLGGIGVDLAHWVPTPAVLTPPTFILVARLLREKGVEQYAAAARIVKQKHPQARFILLGVLDDNPGGITEADVHAWVTVGILEWHGHTPVQRWMAQASVFVLPSFREGVPV